MMKKITIVLLSLLCITSAAIAEETVDVWSGSQSLKPWTSDQDPEQNLAVSYGGRGDLANAFMKDVIIVSYTMEAEKDNYSICLSDPDGWHDMDGTDQTLSYATGTRTYSYVINNVVNLEIIQLRGIVIRGANVTVTKVQLKKVDDHYDAVPVTIGSDGIRTWSHAKNLDFSETGITAYYASAVETETGQVTLTSTATTWNYCGYILRGDKDTYTAKVVPDDQASYHSGNLLKGNVGETTIAASITGTYHYVFAKDNKDNIGFYKLTSNHTLGANKAYLETTTDITPTTPTTPGAPAIHLVFDEENGATALEQFEANDEVQKFIENGQLFIRKNGVTYDLMGRTVK